MAIAGGTSAAGLTTAYLLRPSVPATALGLNRIMVSTVLVMVERFNRSRGLA